MQETIFTKIIRGDIPSHKIYEDELTYAFLDIHPVLPGHVLVIPKNPVEFVWDLNQQDYQAVMETTKKVAQRLRSVTGLPYVHCRIVGTDVPHAHVHLIPFTKSSELSQKSDENAIVDHTALAALAKELMF